MGFYNFTPSSKDQNTEQNFCTLPSMVLNSAKAFDAFDEDGDDLEAVFVHIRMPHAIAVFFLISLGRTFFL